MARSLALKMALFAPRVLKLGVRRFAAAPSSKQLRAHALQNAVPMVGFGVVDCVVMTQAGPGTLATETNGLLI